MFSDIKHAATIAFCRTFNRRSAPLVLLAYFLFALCAWWFLTTSETTYLQVFVTFVLFPLALLLFAIAQSIGIGLGVDERAQPASWRAIVERAGLILLFGGAMFLLAWLAQHGYEWLEAKFVTAALEKVDYAVRDNTLAARSSGWRETFFSSVWWLAFGAALPLLTIHLWSAGASGRLGEAVRHIPRAVLTAFKPRAFLIYLTGALFFAVLPYLILNTRTHAPNAWLEISLLAVRTLLASALATLAWTWMLAALSYNFNYRREDSRRVAEPTRQASDTAMLPAAS